MREPQSLCPISRGINTHLLFEIKQLSRMEDPPNSPLRILSFTLYMQTFLKLFVSDKLDINLDRWSNIMLVSGSL